MTHYAYLQVSPWGSASEESPVRKLWQQAVTAMPPQSEKLSIARREEAMTFAGGPGGIAASVDEYLLAAFAQAAEAEAFNQILDASPLTAKGGLKHGVFSSTVSPGR